MRTRTLALPAVIMLSALSLLASPASAVDSSENAALRYWRAFSLIGDQLTERMSNLPKGGDKEFVLTDEVVSLNNDISQIVTLLQDASKMPECDYAVDYDKGFYAILPHLGPSRISAVLLAFDARVKLEQGEHAAATQSLAAGYRLARHVASDNLMICTLVQLAIFTLIDDTVIYADEQGMLDNSDRAVLLDALQQFEGNDPFEMKASVRAERDLSMGWLRKELMQSGVDPRVKMQELISINGSNGAFKNAWRLFMTNNWNHFFDQLESYYDDILDAWDRPDGYEHIQRIGVTASETNHYGPLGRVLAPALGSFYKQYQRSLSLHSDALERCQPKE